jgi:hypothetical protein
MTGVYPPSALGTIRPDPEDPAQQAAVAVAKQPGHPRLPERPSPPAGCGPVSAARAAAMVIVAGLVVLAIHLVFFPWPDILLRG